MSKAKKTKVLTGAERKAQLLDAGAKLAAKHGSKNVTRRMVATAVGCAEGLVSVYMGATEAAQKAYAKQAKKLGLQEPSKDKQDEIGTKLRAHGPRDPRRARKRSFKEVKAIIKRKVVRSAKTGEFVTKAESKRHPATTVTETVRLPGPPQTKPTAPSSRPAKPSPAKPPLSAPENKAKPRFATKTPPPTLPEGIERPLANSFP